MSNQDGDNLNKVLEMLKANAEAANDVYEKARDIAKG